MLRDFPIPEAELEFRHVRASGPGGQNVNKVSTKVTLKHIPTGLIVTVQDTRSQAKNRGLARERMAQALHDRAEQARHAAIDARELARRRNAPRPPRIKRRMVESKRRRAAVKKERRIRDD
mgnify:CR=1 FL=1